MTARCPHRHPAAHLSVRVGDGALVDPALERLHVGHGGRLHQVETQLLGALVPRQTPLVQQAQNLTTL